MAKSPIEITPEMLERAHTYLTLTHKVNLARKVADACIVEVKISVGADGATPVPPRYMENALHKAQYMMSILAYLYLDVPVERAEDIIMPLDVYEKWGESQVFNQLERLKRNGAVCDKVFDLLADYRATEKMINAEIYARLQIQNDPCARILDMILTQTEPDALKKSILELQSLQSEIAEQEKVHESIVHDKSENVKSQEGAETDG